MRVAVVFLSCHIYFLKATINLMKIRIFAPAKKKPHPEVTALAEPSTSAAQSGGHEQATA